MKTKNGYHGVKYTVALLVLIITSSNMLELNTHHAPTSSHGDNKLIQWELSAPRISLNAPR